MCICVPPDASGLKSADLVHLGQFPYMEILVLNKLQDDVFTDAVLTSLQGCSQLKQLLLGEDADEIQMSITDAAITGSVRLHTHRQLHTDTLR